MLLIILSSESQFQSKEFNVYLVSGIEQGSNHFHFENFLMILMQPRENFIGNGKKLKI